MNKSDIVECRNILIDIRDNYFKLNEHTEYICVNIDLYALHHDVSYNILSRLKMWIYRMLCGHSSLNGWMREQCGESNLTSEYLRLARVKWLTEMIEYLGRELSTS